VAPVLLSNTVMASTLAGSGQPEAPPLLTARLGGITFIVDRSWLTVFVGTILVCATGAWLVIHDISISTALLLGLAMSIGFSVSLLVHELAHAYVSRRMGIEIESIRMFAGGAACKRKHAIDEPAEQFHVAAAGPIASATLGTAALVAAAMAAMLDLYTTVAAVFWFLALVNLLIAISNLLPVFPFDGSKLVHAMFWRRAMDREAASERLDRSGREFSRVTVMLGVLIMTFGGELVLGLVVLLFGVYLLRLPAPP
jgi:Zn-dependent protease